MRKLAILLTLVLGTTGFCDELDKLIRDLRGRSNEQARMSLLYGGPEVDRRLLQFLNSVNYGNVSYDEHQVRSVVNILGHRYSRFTFEPNMQEKLKGYRSRELDPRYLGGIAIILESPVEIDLSYEPYLNDRGPALYDFLLRQAFTGRGNSKRRAISLLREITYASRYDDSPADPALIRLFRRERDWGALGNLHDRDSIPEMRKLLYSDNKNDIMTGIQALAAVPDNEAIPLIIPFLAEESQINEMTVDGKFGAVHWALRTMDCTEYVNLLAQHLEENTGLVCASFLNLIGYFGNESHEALISKYDNDPIPRVAAAAQNAKKRIMQPKRPFNRWYPH